MREFFHGWRQKMGAVTLVMALFLVWGWHRSYATGDIFSVDFRYSQRSSLELSVTSVHGGVGFSRRLGYWSGDSFPPTYEFGPKWHAEKAAGFPWWLEDEGGWLWHKGEFYIGGWWFIHSNELSFTIIISYALIVLPLTILSAYLLFRKHRPKPSQPVPHA